MDREYRTLILAGLLHDVGKLLNKPGSEDHWIKGWEFLSDPDFREPLEKLGLDVDLLLYLVGWHHEAWGTPGEAPIGAPGYRPLRKWISNADGLASGERPPGQKRQSDGTFALDCIFSRIDLALANIADDYKHKPSALTPPAAFPDIKTHVEPLTKAVYAPLIDAFKTDFTILLNAHTDFDSFATALYSLFEYYTWAVPSALDRPPRNLSLFDHSRVTAAIAACQYIRAQEQKRMAGLRMKSFLLAGGDLSGIQPYLYEIANIGPGGVAKRLRARSFRLTAMVEAVALQLLRELIPGYELPLACKILSGGGRFTLLAPNLPGTQEALEAFDQRVNRWLLREFHGNLTMSFAALEMARDDFLLQRKDKATGRPRPCVRLDQLEQKIEARKKQQLASVLAGEDGWREQDFVRAVEYEAGACTSCRKMPANLQDEVNRFCDQCQQDIHTGIGLLQASYLAFSDASLDTSFSHSLTFLDGSIYAYLLPELEKIPQGTFIIYDLGATEKERKAALQKGLPLLRYHLTNHVPFFHSWDEVNRLCDKEKCASRKENCDYWQDMRRIVARDGFPVIYSFSCMAAVSEGRSLLGLLMMDVDELGLAFSEGFQEQASMSRLATLGRMGDLFFSGWLNHVLQTEFRHCYTVYAGGDDLLVVGPWDQIIDLARRVAERFDLYTGRNDNVTISAGIAIVKPKYPLARAVEDAKDALRKAKSGEELRHPRDEEAARAEAQRAERRYRPGGGAVTILGDTITWGQLAEVVTQARELLQHPDDLSSAFLYRVLNYAELYRLYWLGQVEGLRYRALLAYDIARNLQKPHAETRQWVDALMQSLNGRRENPAIRLAGLVASYVLFARRGGS